MTQSLVSFVGFDVDASYFQLLLRQKYKEQVQLPPYLLWNSDEVLCKDYPQLYTFTDDNRTAIKSYDDYIITVVRCKERLPRSGLHLVVFRVEFDKLDDVQVRIQLQLLTI
jgi:hypothetical protein